MRISDWSSDVCSSVRATRRNRAGSGCDGRLRSGLTDAFVDMVRKLLEIIDELLHQRLGSAVIGRLVGPCLARIEQRSVDPRHRDRDEEAEIRVLAELGSV